MATSVVETPRIIATLPTRPQDGDDAYMDAGAAPLMPVLQHLYDAAGALRIAALGQMSGGDRLSVDPGGTSTVFAVRVSRVVGLLSRQTGSTPIYATYTAGETSLDLTDVDGAPAALAADTWYYVYAFCDGTATTAFYISTTAPESSLTWRTGAEGVDRYIGCFRTNGSGAPLAMRMHRGRYTYQKSALGTALRIDGTGIPTTFSAVSVAPLAPPHARVVKLGVEVVSTDTTNWGAVEVRTAGDSGDVYRRDCPPAGSAHDAYVQAEFECLADGSQEVEWRRLSASSYATMTGGLYVLGFTE
jgi:hypothetical protein